jgi:ABC-type phosphate/phosphonate transport system substrate-binding protein
MPFHQKIKYTIMFLLAASGAALVFGTPCKAAGGENRIVFEMYLPGSLLGRGASAIWDDLLRMRAVLKKNEKLDLVITKHDSWREVIARIESGKADLAWLPQYYYQRARVSNRNSLARPLVIYRSGAGTRSKTCIYVRHGALNPRAETPIDNLFNAGVTVPDETGWVMLNLIFREAKYAIGPRDFFKEFRVLNRESAVFALLFDEVDAVVMDELSMKYIVQADDRLSDIDPLICTEPLPNTLIVYRAGMDQHTLAKAKGILLTMHDNPAYAQFKEYFGLTGGRWTPVQASDLKPWARIYQLSIHSGWDKSFATLPAQE